MAFELVGDAVKRPTFAASEVDLARTQTLSSLQLEQSQPASLASRFFAAQLFGAHPYGKRPTPASVRALTVDDLKNFQRMRLVPSGALLVVAGDITLARSRTLAQQYLGDWTGAAPAVAQRPSPPTRTKTEIVLVHRPGSVQSNIVSGNLTYAPSNPNYYGLTVANRILGGGTDSWLFKILREQKSWTYGSYSSLTRNRDIGTMEALAELLRLERSLGTKPVSAKELEAAKGALVGSLPLQLETAQGVAEQVGRFTMLGLPKDFIRTLRPRLAAVTTTQIQTASKGFIRPDAALIVVVGDGAQIYDKLVKIAPTRIINAQGDAMTAADLAPKATALPVDMSKIVERADSFTVLVQGQPLGYQTNALKKTANGWSYKISVTIGPIVQQTVESTFGADLVPQAVKGGGKMQGQNLAVDVTYANGRAKGSSTSPTPQGMKSITVDTTVAPGQLDDNMLGALMPGLKWAPGAKFTVNTFDASSGGAKLLTLNVIGTESVTVPAGTFNVFRVEQTGSDQPSTLFITTAAPHRVVKVSLVGAPIEFVLAK
jgi:predicted Zn-dependent peptidase